MSDWLEKGGGIEARAIQVRGKTIPRVIVQILNNRGYGTAEEIERFFAPSLDDLHPPSLLNGLDRAGERIVRAIKDRERILIHGDYDTDGITGTALLINNLRRFGLAPEYYIPRRLIEGYGLSATGIDHGLKNGCSLMITVDCGITAIREVKYAQDHGLDVIVCDHHEPPSELPAAYALVNPKLSESRYPFRELAGVGVAFKLIQGINERLGISDDELFDDLDLVALGSVVDIVPLIDENRILVKHGLKKIARSKKLGFQALRKETGLTKGVTAHDLAFVIGPRINACGRLRDAREAVELFLATDPEKAKAIAQALSADNRQRQEIEDRIYSEAQESISREGRDQGRIIVVGREGWHEGVVGIVASRISEDYHRPAIILDLQKDRAKGSARSIPGFDITEALGHCRDLLIKYGGHSQAAGLEVDTARIDELNRRINDYAARLDEHIFRRQTLYDTRLNLSDITDDVLYFLKFFEPTGTANPLPVFKGEDLEVVGVPRVVGNGHLKFALRNQARVFQTIAYGQASNILEIEVGRTRIDCLYAISEDSFLGKHKIVLRVKEMKKAG